MSPLTEGTSYWVATTPTTDHPTLATDIAVDVCVVGGGLTGLLTAWELTEAGRTVAVLERSRIAVSVTGYTTAKLTSQHGLRYHRIEQSHGPAAAATYGNVNERAMRRISQLAQLDIKADIQSRAAYVYSTQPDHTTTMQEEAASAARAGLPASFTTDVPVPFPTAGAVRFEDQLEFHPRKLVLGLAAELVARGCLIFEGTKVTDIDPGSPCVVTTEAGSRVRAADVVVATLLPSGAGNHLIKHVFCHQGYAVALPVDHDPLSGGVLISYDRPMRSLRSIPDGGRCLLQVGGAAQVVDPNSGASPWDDLEQWGREHFGAGAAVYRWSTQDYSSADGVPLIGPASDDTQHVRIATGFGGWGMSTAGVAAQLFRESICEGEQPWHALFDPRRDIALADSRVASSRSTSGRDVDAAQVLDRLAPDSATIVNDHGEQVAAYREPDGTLHRVSAVCTHLGGIVLWDRDQREWQCPCHGSRFKPDGAVSSGPARDPLPRR